MSLSPETAREIQSLSMPEFERLWNEAEEALRPDVFRARARTDRALFCRTLFPDLFWRAWSPVHHTFLSRPKSPWRERTRPKRIADLAPRKSAKTTLENKADLVHDACYGFEVCTTVYSTTYGDSERIVKALHEVFTSPRAYPLLHRTFGPFTVEGTQTEFAVTCPGGEPLGSQFAAKSFGGSGRGHLYRSIRPSKVTLDDIVHPQHVNSPKQREDDWTFLNKDVLKSGDVFTLYRMLNTVQHSDDTTMRASRDPSWRCTRWSALIAWPNLARWEPLKDIWSDLNNPEREEAALRYYHEHRAALDEGAEVLWPDGRPLFDLMLDFWSNPASFYSEDQNDPRDPERMVFDVERFRRCRFDGVNIHTSRGRVVPLGDCEVATWLDPSLGKKSSDYPALATVARERKTGYRFALSCSLDKGPPSTQRQRMWERFEALGRGKYGTDETGMGALFGEGFERERTDRQRAGRPWNMPVKGFKLSRETGDNAARISRLEPDAHNGWIEFSTDIPQAVIEMFRDHPHAVHDDGPDAIERADWLLGEALPTVKFGG